jgi:hypothetical protein
MATYYCDTSSATDGVGSFADPANDLVGLLTQTHSTITLTSADTVHVRAIHPADTLPLDTTATLNFTADTMFNSGAEFIVDKDGEIWTGDGAGNFIISVSVDNVNMYIDSTVRMIGFCFALLTTSGSGGDQWLTTRGLSQIIDCHVQVGTPATARSSYVSTAFGESSKIYNCYFKYYHYNATSSQRGVFYNDYDSTDSALIDGCTIDFSSVPANGIYCFMWVVRGRGISYFRNCKVIGTDRIQTFFNWSSSYGLTKWVYDGLHFDVPKLLPDTTANWYGAAQSELRNYDVTVTGTDGLFGFHTCNQKCEASWSNDANYPVLSAILPDKTSGWSIRVLPNSTIGELYPADFQPFHILHTDAASQLKITAEFALEQYYASPTDSEYWVKVVYTDSNNILRHEVGKGSGTALTISNAQWTGRSGNSIPYALQTLVPYSVSLTTAHAVKQGSKVAVTFVTSRPSGNRTHFYFVDPQPKVEAV